jgi:hypothetical protein
MIDWLLINVPLWVLVLVVIGVPALLAMAAVWLVRRRVCLEALAANNEVGGILFAITGTIYAIFLAFTVVVVWEELGQAETIVNEEAASLISLYHTVRPLPEPGATLVQQELRAYTLAVRDDEWETMAHGEPSPRAEETLASLWQTLTAFEPTTNGQIALHTEAIARLSELSRQRQLRIQASEQNVSDLFWAVLLGGAVVTIGFALFFGMPSVRMQAVMTGLMTALIAAGLFLVLVLDRPFTGSVRAEPEAYQHVLALMPGGSN